jgi:hypothetical protein
VRGVEGKGEGGGRGVGGIERFAELEQARGVGGSKVGESVKREMEE